MDVTYRTARRIAIAVLGSTLVLIGVALLVLPGPGLLVIPIGLAVLALEFAWARNWLRKLREHISAKGAMRRAENAESYRRRH